MTSSSKHRQITVGYDGSENSKQAVDWAIENATSGDTIRIIHAWQPPPIPMDMVVPPVFDDSYLHEMLAKEKTRIESIAHDRGLKLMTNLVFADPRNAILEHKADLIVLGARGHGRVVGLIIGSVADYVVHHSKVPVVIIPNK